MDDFSEKRTDDLSSIEESTIFSAPREHNDKKLKSPKKGRIIAAIAAFLAVCILVGGTFAVIKLIPEKDDENASSVANTIPVLNLDKNKFDSVTVENKNGQFVFLPKPDEGADSSSSADNKWYIRDLAEEKISTSKTAQIVSAVAKIDAIMEITKKTFEECGFQTPASKVNVTSKESGDFSLIFGSVSPDNSGVYLYSSIDEKIYLVTSSVSDNFGFAALDLASTDAVPAITGNDGLDGYVENGNIIKLDSINLYGDNFSKPLTIEQIDGDDSENIGFVYRVTSPAARYAESTKVDEILSPFTDGISVSGVYSFDTDEAALKTFGLDDPYLEIKLNMGEHSFDYKFAPADEGFYAVFGDGMNTIKKVSASAINFISIKENDLYNKMVYVRSISEVKNMTFYVNKQVYSFDISENGEDDDEKFDVKLDGKHITSDYFQNFYMHFVSLSLLDFSTGESGNTGMTVKIKDSSDREDTLTFYRASATEYYCSLNGKSVGRITASSFNKLVGDIESVSQNKDVEDN